MNSDLPRYVCIAVFNVHQILNVERQIENGRVFDLRGHVRETGSGNQSSLVVIDSRPTQLEQPADVLFKCRNLLNV